jgi:predicted Fe-Mo cluster-binding NifX family protein
MYKIKKVVVPVTKGLLSEYFEQYNHYELFLIDNGLVRSEEIEIPSGQDVAGLLEWAENTGVTDIIVHKIDKNTIKLFPPQRINIFVGIPIATPQNLIKDYINGNLKSNQQIISEITD